MSMQDDKYRYMFPPKKGDPYPEGCEIFHHKFTQSWKKPLDVTAPSDGSYLRDCWFMRVPLIKWVESLDYMGNTSWVSYGDDCMPKYTVIQAIRENKIVFFTCKRKYFDTLEEAKASYS